MNVRNTIIRVAKIRRFLTKEMTDNDMNKIKISNHVLQKLKDDSSALGRVSLNTIAIIDDYIRDKDELLKSMKANGISRKALVKEITHIGIDLGTRNFLSASDKNMVKTFTTQNQKIGNALSYYQNNYCGKKLTKRLTKDIQSEFDTILNKNIDNVINELINVYGDNMVYVIGNPTPSNQSDNIYDYDIKSFNTIIYKRFNSRLSKYKNKHNIKAVNIDEYSSSVTCPLCSHVSKYNRTSSSNRFECIDCGFHHHTNDEVASCNIVKSYLKQIESEGNPL